MSNHIPERTCVICREKAPKKELFRIVESKNNEYILDEKQKKDGRGIYICKKHDCVARLMKHRKYKISMEELAKMANLLKKERKDYLKILKAMKNSEHLVFGINMVMDEIDHIHFLIIAEDISEKNDKKLIQRAKELGISYVHYGDKKQLGDIFNKDEINVIAVKNKKVAKGLME